MDYEDVQQTTKQRNFKEKQSHSAGSLPEERLNSSFSTESAPSTFLHLDSFTPHEESQISGSHHARRKYRNPPSIDVTTEAINSGHILHHVHNIYAPHPQMHLLHTQVNSDVTTSSTSLPRQWSFDDSSGHFITAACSSTSGVSSLSTTNTSHSTTTQVVKQKLKECLLQRRLRLAQLHCSPQSSSLESECASSPSLSGNINASIEQTTGFTARSLTTSAGGHCVANSFNQSTSAEEGSLEETSPMPISGIGNPSGDKPLHLHFSQRGQAYRAHLQKTSSEPNLLKAKSSSCLDKYRRNILHHPHYQRRQRWSKNRNSTQSGSSGSSGYPATPGNAGITSGHQQSLPQFLSNQPLLQAHRSLDERPGGPAAYTQSAFSQLFTASSQINPSLSMSPCQSMMTTAPMNMQISVNPCLPELGDVQNTSSLPCLRITSPNTSQISQSITTPISTTHVPIGPGQLNNPNAVILQHALIKQWNTAALLNQQLLVSPTQQPPISEHPPEPIITKPENASVSQTRRAVSHESPTSSLSPQSSLAVDNEATLGRTYSTPMIPSPIGEEEFKLFGQSGTVNSLQPLEVETEQEEEVYDPSGTGLAYHPDMLNHRCHCPYGDEPSIHPECPSRLRAVWSRFLKTRLISKCKMVSAGKASQDTLQLVHTAEHAILLGTSAEMRHHLEPLLLAGSVSRLCHLVCGGVGLDSDTVWNSLTSSQAARLAVGQVVKLAHLVSERRLRNGFALVRPPGHHAEPNLAIGFCFFNSVAIAARSVITSGSTSRVLIVDWDVHHGSGTQAVFLCNPSVLYISLHRYDKGQFFPGTGPVEEVGRGAGVGKTVNIAWNSNVNIQGMDHSSSDTPTASSGQMEVDLPNSAGRQVLPYQTSLIDTPESCNNVEAMSDAEYMAAFRSIILPIAKEFNPELVLISAGYDIAPGHPESLGGYKVSPAACAWMTRQLMSLADGRVVLALEGGYNLSTLSNCAEACLRALLTPPPNSPASEIDELSFDWSEVGNDSDCGSSSRPMKLSEQELHRTPCPSALAVLSDVLTHQRPHWKCLSDSDINELSMSHITYLTRKQKIQEGNMSLDSSHDPVHEANVGPSLAAVGRNISGPFASASQSLLNMLSKLKVDIK